MCPCLHPISQMFSTFQGQLQMYFAKSYLSHFFRACTNSLIVGSFGKVFNFSSRHSVGLFVMSAPIKFKVSASSFSSLPTLGHVFKKRLSDASSFFFLHNLTCYHLSLHITVPYERQEQQGEYFLD